MEEQIYSKNIETLVDCFKSDGRLLKIKGDKGRCVVLSDIHNDGSTLKVVIEKYFISSKENKIIICGDYVDRSPSAWLSKPTATLDYLLKLKLKYPDRIFMLMGNHDLNPAKYKRFLPCEFWYSLTEHSEEFYTKVLEALPLVACTENGVIMTHGVLPSSPVIFDDFGLDISELLEFLWGDYAEDFPNKNSNVRTQKGIDDFRRSIDAFGGNILIKGHNPYLPLKMFDNKCVTLSTTSIYDDVCGSNIAILDLSKSVESADDISLVDLSMGR